MAPATFSNSLRSRPEWHALGPALVASAAFEFQEVQTCSFDLILPFSNEGSSSLLNVTLLWSSNSSAAHKDRIRSCLPNEKRANEQYVVVLTDNSNDSEGALSHFSSLQTVLLDLQPLPALLALSAGDILPTLQRYTQELGKQHSVIPPPAPLPTALVAYTTTSAQPLAQDDVNVLTQICHSIRELEEATRTESGQATLEEFLSPIVAKAIVDFWEDEWIAHEC